ncbi:MAG: exosortase/archaeosortase family protein, partial [Opitutaceae bacterium]
AQQTRISIVGFLVILWGVLRLGGGRRWGRAAAFPLAFLVFAIPVNVLDSVGFWLRVWVVDASATLARGAGIAVLRNGTQLLAPDGSYNYDVAAACSGVRSLTALAALSLLAGYLSFRGAGRRVLVFAACFPLVYLGNVARIVAIVFAAQAGGPRWGDLAHEVMGYGVFAIVLGGVLGWASLLGRLLPERRAPGTGAAIPRDASPEELGELAGRPVAKAWLVAAGFLVLAAGTAAFLHGVAARPAGGAAGVALSAGGIDPVELPAFLGTEWIGRSAAVSAVEREILPADTGYSRKTYVAVADPQRQVFFSVVLSGRDRTSIHRPELCLVGQGWTIADSERRSLGAAGREGNPAAGGIPVTLLRVRREVATPRGREVRPQLVAYFFAGPEGAVGGHTDLIRRDAWNRVRHGRADRWAYVLMQTDARDGDAAALARMDEVLRGVWPSLVPSTRAPAPGEP